MKKNKIKDLKSLERIIKGFANQKRIAILELLDKKTELSVVNISEKLKSNFKTISEHIRKLEIAGLVTKKYQGSYVNHRLTKRGKLILKFCRILDKNYVK
jgi:DNA-binding transcriptional ArsR family regulator